MFTYAMPRSSRDRGDRCCCTRSLSRCCRCCCVSLQSLLLVNFIVGHHTKYLDAVELFASFLIHSSSSVAVQSHISIDLVAFFSFIVIDGVGGFCCCCCFFFSLLMSLFQHFFFLFASYGCFFPLFASLDLARFVCRWDLKWTSAT